MTKLLDDAGSAVNRRSAADVLPLLAEDARLEVPQFDAVWDDKESIKSALQALFAALPDLTWKPAHRYVGEDQVTEEGVWSGTHSATLAGYPASGRELMVRARVAVDHTGSTVTAVRVSVDVAAMKMAIGLVVSGVEQAATSASITAVAAPEAMTLTERSPDSPDLPVDEGQPRRRRPPAALLVGLCLAAGAVAVGAYLSSRAGEPRSAVLGQTPEPAPSTSTSTSASQSPSPSPAPAAPALPEPAQPESAAGVTTQGDQVTLSADVLFDSGSAQLTERAQAAISEVAALLVARRLNGVVAVDGYTDSTGSPAGNLALSTARAQTVVTALQQQPGVAGIRFQVRGLGAATPVADNADPNQRGRNRRVTILLPTS